MSKLCHYCQQENEDDSKHCVRCGSPFCSVHSPAPAVGEKIGMTGDELDKALTIQQGYREDPMRYKTGLPPTPSTPTPECNALAAELERAVVSRDSARDSLAAWEVMAHKMEAERNAALARVGEITKERDDLTWWINHNHAAEAVCERDSATSRADALAKERDELLEDKKTVDFLAKLKLAEFFVNMNTVGDGQGMTTFRVFEQEWTEAVAADLRSAIAEAMKTKQMQ